MDQEENIDLKKFFRIAWNKKSIISIVLLISTIISYSVFYVNLKKLYESTATIEVVSLNKSDSVAIMKSNRIVDAVTKEIYKEQATQEKNDELQKRLQIYNLEGTNIIEIKGKGESPSEAQDIVQGVIGEFQRYIEINNQQEFDRFNMVTDERLQAVEKNFGSDFGNLKAGEGDFFTPQNIYIGLSIEMEKEKIMRKVSEGRIRVIEVANLPQSELAVDYVSPISRGITVGIIISLVYLLMYYKRSM